MAEEYLQAAFEIKTMCDELSRRLLRWHWEKQDGKTLPQLAEYVAQRTQQAPEYFSRMPELAGVRDWQKLDTTVCMRVLLDPGDGAEGTPLRLLSAAPRPVAARHACNGLRVARNAAAHATEPAGAAEAAACFAETVEDLAESYGEAVFTAAELQKYRKAAARAVQRCGGPQPEPQFLTNDPELPLAGAKPRAADGGSAGKPAAKRKTTASPAAGRAQKPAVGQAKKPAAGRSGTAGGKARSTAKRRAAARRRPDAVQALFLALGAAVLLAALYLRAQALGLLP